jgi:hypothetical protein
MVRQYVLFHSYIEILTSTIHIYFDLANGRYERVMRKNTHTQPLVQLTNTQHLACTQTFNFAYTKRIPNTAIKTLIIRRYQQ